MGRYFKQKLADWLLCTAISVSLIPSICSGFVLTDPWSRSIAVILVCSLLLQLCFTLLSRSKATIWLGIGIGGALAVAVFVWMRAAKPLSGGADNSLMIFALIQVLVPLLVYLLGRSRWGIAALFLTGTLICAGCHFLQYPAPDWCLYPFLGGTAALFFLRVYTVSVRKSELEQGGAHGYARQVLALCAVALAAAVGLYAAVIAPLQPPTRELKLISELRSMELLQVLGVSSTEIILDPDLTADVPLEELETDQDTPDEEPEEPQIPDEPEEPFSEAISSALEQAADAIRYDETVCSRLWLLLLIPAAVIAAYVLRYLDRRHWHRRVCALPPESAVVNYYHFFLSRLGRAGLKKQSGQTLREFASHITAQTEPFDACGVSFRSLTEIYEAVIYGRHAVSDGELRGFEQFYDAFYPALRRETGRLKYYLKAFCY